MSTDENDAGLQTVIVRTAEKMELPPDRIEEYLGANYTGDEYVRVEDAVTGEIVTTQGEEPSFTCGVCGEGAHGMSVVDGVKRWHHHDDDEAFLCREKATEVESSA